MNAQFKGKEKAAKIEHKGKNVLTFLRAPPYVFKALSILYLDSMNAATIKWNLHIFILVKKKNMR